jgi:hypothetical protein
MDKRKISEDVYERYVDASVALFMEYYAASCLDGKESPHTDGKDFPAELDTRCRALINRECSRQKRKTLLKAVGKGLRAVACLAVVILSLSSILFMTVDAVRIPIINYYIEKSDQYWRYNGESQTSLSTSLDALNCADPLYGFLPNDYTLHMLDSNLPKSLTAIYRSHNGDQVFFAAQSANSSVGMDSEGAEYSKQFQIAGYDAVLYVEKGYVRLLWICEDLSCVFSLTTNGMTDTEVISLATQLIHSFSN